MRLAGYVPGIREIYQGGFMNSRISKKIRKLTRRNWREWYIEYMAEIIKLPLKDRLRIGWYIVRGKK